MKKSILAFLSILLFTSINVVFAKSNSISIQIIQNNPGQEKVWSTSEYFEQSIIDYFFDSGKIVSNSPIYISSKDDNANKKALKAALIENNDGGMDFLVRVELFFKNSKSVAPDVPKLGNISKVEWKVYKVGTGLEVDSGSANPGKVTTNNDNEVGISNFAKSVASKLNGYLE